MMLKVFFNFSLFSMKIRVEDGTPNIGVV